MKKCKLCDTNKAVLTFNGDDVCPSCYDGLLELENNNKKEKENELIHQNFRSSISRIFNFNNNKKI